MGRGGPEGDEGAGGGGLREDADGPSISKIVSLWTPPPPPPLLEPQPAEKRSACRRGPAPGRLDPTGG